MTTVLKTKLENTVNNPAIPVGREKKLNVNRLNIYCVRHRLSKAGHHYSSVLNKLQHPIILTQYIFGSQLSQTLKLEIDVNDGHAACDC